MARGTTRERGYDTAHNRLRILAFQRDGWRCVDCGWRPAIVVECEQCGIDEPPAQVIVESLRIAYNRGERHLHGDHIIPIGQRPDLVHDLDNYATRCNVCHNIKTARGDIVTPNIVTLVCGAPGSGKSTYVDQYREPNDIVWDFDSIMHAITGMPIHSTPGHAVGYAKAMRDAFYAEAKKPLGHRIWIVEGCPTRAERERFKNDLKARIVFLDVPEQVCLDRVRGRGEQWPAIVSKWFAANHVNG